MKALLLCAGVGSRLRPMTDHTPKCIVPIRGKPLLEIWLKTLIPSGFDRILINTHHKSEMVRGFVEKSPWRDQIEFVYEESLLGTGGTLLANRNFFDDDEGFLVAHADNLTIFNPQLFWATHQSRPENCSMTMMLFHTPTPESCGIVEIDNRCVVQKFHEKVANPPGNLANAAVYIFEPSIFNFLESVGKSVIDLSTEVLPHFMGSINTFVNTSYHRDIGTIQSWSAAQNDFPIYGL